jgi:hypothetical protein
MFQIDKQGRVILSVVFVIFAVCTFVTAFLGQAMGILLFGGLSLLCVTALRFTQPVVEQNK